MLPARQRGSVTVRSLLPDKVPGTQIERLELPGGLVLVHGLEHDVALELFADVRLQLQRRHLQEADGLLQLRGHGQCLTQLQLQ